MFGFFFFYFLLIGVSPSIEEIQSIQPYQHLSQSDSLFQQILMHIKDPPKTVSSCTKFSEKRTSPQNRNQLLPPFRKYLKNYYPSILRKYNSDDSQVLYRQMVYTNNLFFIKQHNSDVNRTYKMTVNKFAILSDEQFEKIYLSSFKGYFIRIFKPFTYRKILDTPQSFDNGPEGNQDYKGKKCISSTIFDQQYCGSCYAIATLDSIYMNMGFPQDQVKPFFSIEQILTCSNPRKSMAQGCKGGTIQQVFQYIQTKGVFSISQSQFNCDSSTENKTFITYKGIKQVNSCQDLSLALLDFVVVSYVHVGKQVRFYKGRDGENGENGENGQNGYVVNQSESSVYANHAVVVIESAGMFNNKKIYKVKNSWGSTWGQKGFGYFHESTGICKGYYYDQHAE